jgi:putative phosphoesterase
MKQVMIRAGILSDTHLNQADERFIAQTRECFRHCDTIIHAGDITALPVLTAFADKTLYAVCGNTCNASVRAQLPNRLVFSLGRFTIGLAHGAGLGYDIENALLGIFPEADCIIYGHTHRAICQRHGTTLLLNPGTFQASSSYGAHGTYAILEVSDSLSARIYERPFTLYNV